MTHRFSPDLHAELVLALAAYADTNGAPRESDRLAEATAWVCREATKAGMTSGAMVIALRATYDAVAEVDAMMSSSMRGAYDRLLSSCLQAYFEERGRPKS